MPLLAFGLLALGYLMGSIPFGVLVSKVVGGTDLRSAGSGNIGATNVARVLGKKLGALVLLLDALKGALPVLLGCHLFPQLAWLHGGIGLAAFLGHVFPVWLKFKGGKGVATALGVLLVLVPIAALSGAALWLLFILTLRLSSVGSLLGGLLAVVVAILTAQLEYAVATSVFLALMIFTHRGNLVRLYRRTENEL